MAAAAQAEEEAVAAATEKAKMEAAVMGAAAKEAAAKARAAKLYAAAEHEAQAQVQAQAEANAGAEAEARAPEQAGEARAERKAREQTTAHEEATAREEATAGEEAKAGEEAAAREEARKREERLVREEELLHEDMARSLARVREASAQEEAAHAQEEAADLGTGVLYSEAQPSTERDAPSAASMEGLAIKTAEAAEPSSSAPASSARKKKTKKKKKQEAQRFFPGMCRICFGDSIVPQLVAPCGCLGDRRLVHPQCLVRWQQQGHLHECEVCHSPWTYGLQANAVPPSPEVAVRTLAACEAAIRADDLPSLRRRLSSHLVQSSGQELLLLAARHGQQGALEELARAGADCDAASHQALSEGGYAVARLINRAGGVPLPFSELLDDGQTIFPVGAGGVDAGYPGNNSRVLDRVVRGDAGMVRIFWAYGIDLNDPPHRFGPEQISLLMMAIDYAPETVTRAAPEHRPTSGRTNVVRALIECGSDINYCTERSTALISAIMRDDVQSTVMLLHAGASTSLRPSVIQRGDWVLADVTCSRNSRCSPELLRACVCFQLTGLTRHASECFADPRRVHENAHRTQHCPEMILGGELQTWADGLLANMSGGQLRERGNKEMRDKLWENAAISYSAALIAGIFVGDDVEPDPEPHKILANRSLAHLRLAQAHAQQEAEARSEMQAKALMAAPGRRKTALPPLPDLMEALGDEAQLGAAVKEPTPAQAARGLRQSMSYRALAFADATRAAATAPIPWAKAHARVAESACEIGVQCWARGDRHGTSCMRQIAGDAYRRAAEIEPSGGFITCAMGVEKDLLEPLPRCAGEADDEDDDDSPLGGLKQHVRLLTDAGITESDLAAAGFTMPSAAELAGMDEAEIAALQAQLDAAVDTRPDFDEKMRVANRRRMQGGTDIPATREVASAAPYGAANELWTMSYSTIGYTRGETPFWAISIVDSTPMPHPYTDLLVGSGVHHGSDAPTLEECEDTLLRAIQYPCPASAPSRRPRRLVLAWRMRGMYEALEGLAGGMGIVVTLETYEVALAIAAAHGKSIEGRNHGPAT